MKKVIPATTKIICDICGDRPENTFRCDAHLDLNRLGLDWNNAPVGDASTAYDLCDKCALDIELMLMTLKRERWSK